MFVDTAKVKLQAGKGGDGAVSFRHEIYIPKGGPDGGDGGKGGSIIFRADKDTNTLIDFRFNPELTAEDGKNGSGQRSAGRSGRNLVVEVPIGTIVYRLENAADGSEGSSEASAAGASSRRRIDGSEPSGTCSTEHEDSARAARSVSEGHGTGRLGPKKLLVADLDADGKEAVVARGGDGGFGNAHFKSSTRQAPVIAEVGEPGEAYEAVLELKLLADVGLVGLPNAGKSTFLSRVSNARPEIADYPFTTLTPQLGVATIDEQDLLIADIPGLIEGAADGKGLGHDFLRHVDRTAVLLHLIDVYNNDAGEAYRIIRGELERYAELGSRPEIVALTKCEGADEEIIAMQTAAILAVNPSAVVYSISAQSGAGLTDLLRALKSAVAAGAASSPTTGAYDDPAEGGGAKASARDADNQAGAGPHAAEPHKESATASRADAWRQDPTLPVITLSTKELSNAWKVEKQGDKFVVTGAKIEKFARRTDLSNYASVNRLRDIMKKLGIRAELTSQGAEPTSIISIAGKEFTLVEDY